VQYGALPYRFTQHAALEVLLVTTRETRRWIVPKGWPIKGLRPAKSAAREAFEEAGVIGKIGAKPVGLFTYDKMLDEAHVKAICEVKVYPLLVKRQSEIWPESEQRTTQWVEPSKAIAMIKEPGLKKIVASFAKRIAAAASRVDPALHEVASGLEHRIGGACHKVVVQALDVAQEVERRRLRCRGAAMVAKPGEMGLDCLGLPAAEYRLLLRQNFGGAPVAGHEYGDGRAKVEANGVESLADRPIVRWREFEPPLEKLAD
jgi:8-oxo-dGTP pyrophosphatase MutT (NUDIX family)